MFLPDMKNLPQLDALFNLQGNSIVLELDQSPQLADLLGLDLNIQNNLQILNEINLALIKTAQEFISGAVFDPIYTFDLLNENNAILRMESLTSGVDPLSMPVLINNWGVENIKNNFASAKLELYYHPQEMKALEKKQLVAEIYDYCQHEKIPLFLKLVLYTPADEDFNVISFQESQFTAIQEFRSTCDMLILQFPQDALASATVTAELDIPWLLTGQGIDYELFKENLRTSLENGASGCLVGSVLWKELGQMRLEDNSIDFDAINRFISTNFRDRLIEIKRIVEENYVENS